MPDDDDVLCRLPIGDSHIPTDTEENDLDLQRIVALATGLSAGNDADRIGQLRPNRNGGTW